MESADLRSVNVFGRPVETELGFESALPASTLSPPLTMDAGLVVPGTVEAPIAEHLTTARYWDLSE